MSTIQEELWHLLKQVPYPGYSRDLVSFGVVKGLDVEESGKVTVTLQFSTEPEDLRQKIRGQIETVLMQDNRVREVAFQVLQRQLHSASVPEKRHIPGVEHVIAVASAKGGVGKSTVAVNLAVALRRRGRQVGYLDADIYGPSGTIMLTSEREPAAQGNRIVPAQAQGMPIISIGFFLPSEEQALVWRGPMVMKAVHQLLWDVNWGELDFLVVDLPPGTGDAQLTLLQEVHLAGAVIVTTPQRVALVDARKGVTMFEKLGTPIIGIVENMSYFRCPQCSTEYDIFSRGGGRTIAEDLGVPFLGEIPIEPRLRAGADQGADIFTAAPDSEAAHRFEEVAQKVEAFLASHRS